jgi:hypothetical protein
MNSPLDLVEEVRRRDGTLFLAGGELKYRGPRDAMTDELRAMLREYKPDLMRLLAKPSDADHAEPDAKGNVRPNCFMCSKFRPIGTEAGCLKPGDPNFTMGELIECRDFGRYANPDWYHHLRPEKIERAASTCA